MAAGLRALPDLARMQVGPMDALARHRFSTPAGQVLISNGLFTLSQLQALGGVIGGTTPSATAAFGPLQPAPAGAMARSLVTVLPKYSSDELTSRI